MPECVTELSNFSLSLECIDHFSTESKLQMHELFTITINSQGQENDFFSVLDDFGEQVANLFSRKQLGIDLSLLKQLLSGFVNPQMDQILFKQFLDGSSDSAVYQSVMHSPSMIKKIHHFKFLKPEFTSHLNKLDSFPLADMFGLKLGSQTLHCI
ncbi:hypothetical protein LOC50_05845 [Pseudoalteromonas sp. SCSIO 43095]|uniref:hypothetical protein n=1 Tax=Pseudoalteromonas sp. SCSIO 43095 TaxID=2894202 RepID=UPI00202B1B74|nr:hypothetical protein [Pseudoalteromonas sp. SCSIO 43095]URQ99798.1 hypothetical protein LOC50_05845 [Pseudoalteromonas sp. SCSIO 43095]